MFFIPIEELPQKYKDAIQKMLVKYEAGSCQLSARLKKTVEGAFAVFINEISTSDLYGVLSFKGTFLFCLPFTKGEQKDSALQQDFSESFVQFYKTVIFKNKKLNDSLECVCGVENASRLVLSCLEGCGLVPEQVNHYHLMALDTKVFVQNKNEYSKMPEGFWVLKCKSGIDRGYQEQLELMQAAYEKEEVLPDNQEFDSDSCRLRLKNAQRTQVVLSLVNSQGLLVSKAATNAIGYKFIQIGGVFTPVQYRNNHYSQVLVFNLCQKILRTRHLPILFVKKENIPAMNLYKKLGFKVVGGYTILYFKTDNFLSI